MGRNYLIAIIYYNFLPEFIQDAADGFESTERSFHVKFARTAVLLLLAGITALSASQSMAQFRGGFPGGGGSGGGMRGGGGGRDGTADSTRNQRPAQEQNAPAQTEVLMHELYEDLKLTPAQQAAWQSYTDKVQALASDLARERSRAQAGAQLNALQQLDRSLDAARNRLTGLEDVAAAAKTLYDSLTPEQRTVADSRLAKIIPSSAAERPANPSEQTGRRRNSQ
jgi:parvulin-like peptidyl-prolyl isomerase